MSNDNTSEKKARKLGFLDFSHIPGVSSTPWKAEKKAPVELGNIREKVAETIDEAIAALQAPDFERHRMVRPARIGFAVKIGYGQRNEALLAEVRCRDVGSVVAYLENARTNLGRGAFDEAIGELLKSYRERAEKGKEARKKKQKTTTQTALAA